MKLQISGVKSGQTIQLLEVVNIPDGVVFLEIETNKSNDKSSRLERLNHLFGVWQNETELDLIFTEIDNQRHNDCGRSIDSFDF